MRRLACMLAVAQGGCVVSVQPVVTAAASTFDTRLLGYWTEADGGDRIVVTRGDANSYEIEYTESEGRVGLFEAHLGRLGQRSVLDVQPARRETSPMPEGASLIRGHVLYAIVLYADSAHLALLNPRTLREAIKTKAVSLEGFDDRDQLVLTGSTAELSRALVSYLDRPGALDNPSTWRRTPARTASAQYQAEKEVRGELAAIRTAAVAGDWPAMKRFFPEGSRWAEQAEQWVRSPHPASLSFFAPSAQTDEGKILLRLAGRDTVDILAPYFVSGERAFFGARFVRGKVGWVMACSSEAHGFSSNEPGCSGQGSGRQP